MHPRNRHADRYDFARLVRSSPALAPYVRPNPRGDQTIDFADPAAVTALNRAILGDAYGITSWVIPSGYLCPPIPGRADAVHHVADLLAASAGGRVPRGPNVRALDVGVGANCIYPIIGTGEYGWRWIGTEIDDVALAAARQIVAANPALSRNVDLRRQADPRSVFNGILQCDERVDATLCNPPFHASAAEAKAGTQRKRRNLGLAPAGGGAELNFGGRAHELWCEGGETGFIRRMVAESPRLRNSVLWFSSLVSKRESLPSIHAALERVAPAEVKTITMSRGQKVSRLVAWTFLTSSEQRAWAHARWNSEH